MSLVMIFLGTVVILPLVKRTPLVLSFVFSYTLTTLLRSFFISDILSFDVIFIGAITTPAFFLFTFFMITDPATSPSSKKDQVLIGLGVGIFDFCFHMLESYYTFFYSYFIIQSAVFIKHHVNAIHTQTFPKYFKTRFVKSGYYKNFLFITFLGASLFFLYQLFFTYKLEGKDINFNFKEQLPEQTSINHQYGGVLNLFDPKLQHISRLLIPIGDSVASGDINNDGLIDLLFTAPMKQSTDRNSLYLNKGNFQFEKFQIKVLDPINENIKHYGLPTHALMIDYDNDGDQDIFISYISGSPLLLRNELIEKGLLSFSDITQGSGLKSYSNSMGSIFFDINNDGLLDLVISNFFQKYYSNYEAQKKVNVFKLPSPEYKGDDRMFDIMISSFISAQNGGSTDIYIQQKDHTFQKQDTLKWGFFKKQWTLAIGASDFNNDGYNDLYFANDFGPDEFYINRSGKRFKYTVGKFFGEIGRDPYKGMNVSISDFDQNNYQDIHVSNVHHYLISEGSLFWMNAGIDKKNNPVLNDKSTRLGITNERRFGWGATAADFDNDGLIDMAQANGMLDNFPEPPTTDCPNYHYILEKMYRSKPSELSMINRWPDIRGYCYFGNEKNRLFLNKKYNNKIHFVDVADSVGLTAKGNSRGMSSLDLDNNGSIDLVTTHQYQTPTIFKNILKTHQNWVAFQLIGNGTTCNRDAINSRVTLTYKNYKQMKEVFSIHGLSAQSDRRVHFGLNNHSGPVNILIKWCNQEETRHTINDINQYHTITQQN